MGVALVIVRHFHGFVGSRNAQDISMIQLRTMSDLNSYWKRANSAECAE